MNQKYRFELLEVPGAENVRDIGGYPGEGGLAVNRRRFIRAGGMHGLLTPGVKAVRELGVGCVADLRSTYERRKMPDTLEADGRIAYVHIPMLDYIQSNFATGDFTSLPASMADMYTGLLENGKKDFLRLFHVFADPGYETVLFHCTAGKDRTGLAAMLLLGLAGVSREDIVYDYSFSDRLVTQNISGDDGLPRYLFESDPATMERVIDYLGDRYGGIRGYLERIGVRGELRRAVRRKLLGEA